MKKLWTALVFVSAFFFAGNRATAQILDYMNKVSVVLSDGTNVTLYGAARTMDTLFQESIITCLPVCGFPKSRMGRPSSYS
ncbi:MAG: hypothetical protein IPL65_11020 [Lewinellaceae bacterium]|nr:hypothetical protein [Lewinellaceae bacterium]